jgi:uncharacterized protein (DUF1330 family)
MAVYVIIEAVVKDPEKYREYISKVPEIVARHGGRYLARGNRVIALSEAWKPERMILLEFPAEKNVYEWLSSSEYQAVAQLRETGADTRAIMIEGSVD